VIFAGPFCTACPRSLAYPVGQLSGTDASKGKDARQRYSLLVLELPTFFYPIRPVATLSKVAPASGMGAMPRMSVSAFYQVRSTCKNTQAIFRW